MSAAGDHRRGEGNSSGERSCYRLVRLTRTGLFAYDRQGFSTLDKAEEWRDKRRREQRESLGIAFHAALPPDLVMVDREWLGPEHLGTLYLHPDGASLDWWPDPPEAGPGPQVATRDLVVHAQPLDWIGKLFVDVLGSGWVWNGWELLGVMDHRICAASPPGYRGLYAWNVEATQMLGDLLDSDFVRGIGLFPLDRELRERWRLSPLADYILLRRPARDLAEAPRPARTPWAGVAVSAGQLLEVGRVDCLRPLSEALDIYRPARLTPAGLAAIGLDGYTTLEGARAALKGLAASPGDVRAVTVSGGLPADVTRLDGDPFRTERERVASEAIDRVAWVDPAGAGRPVVDADGHGFLLGRSMPVRVAGGHIAEEEAFLAGAPAWIYRVFAKARVDPMTPHVHGVVVKVDSRDVESWGLPEGTKAVLLARGRGARTLTWRCLDRDAVQGLGPADAPAVSLEGDRSQLPAGRDAGSDSGEKPSTVELLRRREAERGPQEGET